MLDNLIISYAAPQTTDIQQTIRKMELLGKASLQGKRTPLGRMKLGGSFLVKDPTKATEECKVCGFKSTIKGKQTCFQLVIKPVDKSVNIYVCKKYN